MPTIRSGVLFAYARLIRDASLMFTCDANAFTRHRSVRYCTLASNKATGVPNAP